MESETAELAREVERLRRMVERLASLENATLFTWVGLVNGIEAPEGAEGYAVLFVDAADGALKVMFDDGTTRVLATRE